MVHLAARVQQDLDGVIVEAMMIERDGD